MITELAHYSGRIAKISGPSRSGKTEILVQRCATLLEQGVATESILVVVSSALAADHFRQRLQNAVRDNLKEEAAHVPVSQALAVCTDILDEPKARALTGRIPRILNDSEYLFFLEDLKTLGQKNQRLSNMLLFFYAQWSAFEDEEKWLIPGEETTVLTYARELLTSYKAMLRHEAPYLCGKLLLSDEGKGLAQRYDYVLCDDFQNLSRAEQATMCLCARKQVMVCGNPLEETKVNTDYPCAKGFILFEQLRKNVEVFTLSEMHGIEQALLWNQALCAVEQRAEDVYAFAVATEEQAPRSTDFTGTSAGFGALSFTWNTPEEEFHQLGSLIRAFNAQNPEAALSDVAIAVPNKRWGKLVKTALKQHGIAASTAGLNPRIGGDPRIPGHHDALTAYALLSLVANPEDSMAWRVFTGLDDALTNSEAWKSLHTEVRASGHSLYEALASAASGTGSFHTEILKQKALERSWAVGQEVIAHCSSLRGRELAQALGLTRATVYNEALASIKGTEDAVALFKLISESLASPRFPQKSDLVHIVLYENLCGLEYQCLLVPAMVNGLIPYRDALDDSKTDARREQVMHDDRIRLSSAITKGTRYLIVSNFTRTDIETAERAKIKVSRIASIGGKRVVLVSPSLFLEEAGAACPGLVPAADMGIERIFLREGEENEGVQGRVQEALGTDDKLDLYQPRGVSS